MKINVLNSNFVERKLNRTILQQNIVITSVLSSKFLSNQLIQKFKIIKQYILQMCDKLSLVNWNVSKSIGKQKERVTIIEVKTNQGSPFNKGRLYDQLGISQALRKKRQGRQIQCIDSCCHCESQVGRRRRFVR